MKSKCAEIDEIMTSKVDPHGFLELCSRVFTWMLVVIVRGRFSLLIFRCGLFIILNQSKLVNVRIRVVVSDDPIVAHHRPKLEIRRKR